MSISSHLPIEVLLVYLNWPVRLVILVVHLGEGKGVWKDALQPNQTEQSRE